MIVTCTATTCYCTLF